MFLYNFYIFLIHLWLISIVVCVFAESEYCEISNDNSLDKCGKNKYLSNKKRYILYDVNPPEGFNLRRDVYVRVAVFINNLKKSDNEFQWFLVLPPWEKSYHWRSQDIGKQSQIPWSKFFDIESLKKFIPVIEMYDFLKEYESQDGKTILDRVFYLQNDPKMFETGDFKERNDISKCFNNQNGYRKNYDDKFTGNFWGYQNITADKFDCITFHGTMSGLIENLKPNLYKSFMFDHMEIPLHDEYGSRDYWQARRSMRYNKYLYKIALNYRRKYFNSTDENDNIKRPANWQQEEKKHRDAIGGEYLAAHLRRRDFLRGHSDIIPSIKNSALQLDKKMKKLGLDKIFIATDADDKEFNELKNYLSKYKVFRYTPTNNQMKKIKDGGVAIVDQIICSYARYFVGTDESTFTFRIQEDREILGFKTKTTFNRLCGNEKNKNDDCKPGSQWEIRW